MSEENPRLAMYEAQAIAIEKQLKIDKLEQEKEELIELMKRLGKIGDGESFRIEIDRFTDRSTKSADKEEMAELKTKNKELEERLKALELDKQVWSGINGLTGQISNIQDQIEEMNARFKDFQEKMEETTTKLWQTVNDLRKEDLPKNIVNKLQTHENTILILGGAKNGTLDDGILVLSQDRSKWIQPQLKYSGIGRDHGAVYLNGEIYLIGGQYNPNRLCKLDKNLKWINLADMNVGRNAIINSCLVWNGYIWVFGGCDENFRTLKSVERYDLKENKWTLMPDMKQARFGAAAVLWNDRIIITGGQEEFLYSPLNTTECFKDDFWTTLANLPNPLCNHSLLLYKNKLLIMGDSDKKPLYNVREIDPNELTGSTNAKWKEFLPMKTQRYLFRGTILNDEIYVIGGYSGLKEPGYLDCVEIFNGEKWRDGPSLPHALYNMPAVIIPQTLADRLCNYHH